MLKQNKTICMCYVNTWCEMHLFRLVTDTSFPVSYFWDKLYRYPGHGTELINLGQLFEAMNIFCR